MQKRNTMMNRTHLRLHRLIPTLLLAIAIATGMLPVGSGTPLTVSAADSGYIDLIFMSPDEIKALQIRESSGSSLLSPETITGSPGTNTASPVTATASPGTASASPATTTASPTATPLVPGAADTDMRGLWVASVLNIDWPSKPTTDSSVLKTEADKVLDYAVGNGFNAVFLQVRPTADAMYLSKLFPVSRFLTGSQGTAPTGGFDPLTYWVAGAHARGLELHAWINPYRITKKTSAEAIQKVTMLAQSNPARIHPEWTVTHTDGNLYFNPGIPEVRQLICDGITELMDRYAIDGIHMDDYFYPGAIFADSDAYKRYGKNYATIQDWRRSNVDTLVQKISTLVRSRSGVRFGISPFGIWRNKASSPAGSDTNGLESYSDHYADSVNWVKQGWVDYITPQIYWNIGYAIADYQKLALWWANVVKDTGVELYVGQAAYRTDADDAASAWYGAAEMSAQFALNRTIPQISGSIFYNYKSLTARPGVMATIKSAFEYNRLLKSGGTAAASAIKPVTVGRPAASLSTTYEGYYLTGVSDPSKPLYLNGALVENRSSKGYFGVFVPLAKGKNTFVFSQIGTSTARSIFRKTSTSTVTAMTTAGILPESTWPQNLSRLAPGETVKLTCKAPAGAKVTVKVNGQTLSMTPAAASANSLVPTTFTASWTLPKPTGTARVVDLGKPVYTMVYGKTTVSATAPGSCGVVMPGAPYVAEMKEETPIYNDASTDGGTRHMLAKGSREAVVSVSGGYAKLVSGYYAKTDAVTLSTPASYTWSKASAPVYTVGTARDTLVIATSLVTAATIGCDGTKITLSLPITNSGAVPSLPAASLFKSATVEKSGSTLRYVLTLKDGARLDGFMLDNAGTAVTVTLKRHVKGVGGLMPLTGKTVLLDPGHGGTGEGGDPGAIGPMGTAWSEKNINLANALAIKAALEARGATVVMTRATDIALSLEQRLAINRKTQPDLFISIHADSMSDNVDISRIKGFSVFYRETIAKGFADVVNKSVIGTLARTDRGINQKNFYVIRGTWTPSILLEAGFVPNPAEFEWMTDAAEQRKLAESVANAAVSWFAN